MAARIPHLTRGNIIVIGCCIGISLAVIVLGPVLQMQQKTSVDRKINETQKRVEVLKRAAELRQILHERISGLETTTGPLPVAAEPLSSDQADQVLEDLHMLAGEAGVLIADVRPDLKSMGQNSKTMLIGTTIYGSMSGFQNMLDSLLQLTYVERLQRILVSAESEGLQLETDFTVHIK
jgi:hypothetical protein